MIQGSEDLFIRTSGGLYVAWSLNVPSAWGDWVLVEVVTSQRGRRTHKLNTIQIYPYRAMCEEEVQGLRRCPLLLWGMKVANAPWALVLCREAIYPQTEIASGSGYNNPTRAIGV
jgi:hypothetical protein